MVEDYDFGRIVVDGKPYHSDVLLFPDGRILSPWWREESHRLGVADLQALIDTQPEVLIVGTGSSGMLQPTEDLPGFLARRAIELVALPTDEAVRVYNDLCRRRAVAACFHLTC